MAKEQIPEKSDWELWEHIIPQFENMQSSYAEIEEYLKREQEQNKLQRNQIKEWAKELIILQNENQTIDLDDNDKWECPSKKMNDILFAMKSNIVNEACKFRLD